MRYDSKMICKMNTILLWVSGCFLMAQQHN